MLSAAEQVTRASNLIRGLRDFIARRESEKQIESVTEILREAVRLALVRGDVEAATIEIQCTPAASIAFFDRVQIEQVVFYLVRNAIEAMANSARRMLTITAALAPDKMVEISVADTGPGLSSAVREKLFEPFVTSKSSGLGIGRLEADDNPGGGTIFRFTLPQSRQSLRDGVLPAHSGVESWSRCTIRYSQRSQHLRAS